jgi:hypothetical protein
MMTQDEKWDYINKLDEELLVGGVMLSEWSTSLVKDADTAFCSSANLAAILVSQAAIESHLRFEYPESQTTKRATFYDLIENAPLPGELKVDLHRLRKYRNKWVHVNDPREDQELLDKPGYYESELEDMAKFAITVLREVIYLEQFV